MIIETLQYTKKIRSKRKGQESWSASKVIRVC